MDLKELGLTANEAKAYEALLNLGKSSAADVSKESGVPYGRIYPVLDSLQMKGLVKIIPEKTKMFMPSDPESLSAVIKRRKEELDLIEQKVRDFKAIYEEHEKEAVQISRGKKNFYKVIREMRKPQKYEISLKYTFDTHPEFRRSVQDTLNRNLSYKLLGRVDRETKEGVETWKGIVGKIAPIQNEGVALSVIDDEELMVTLIKSNEILLFTDRPFIKLMRQLLEFWYEHHG